MRHLHFDLQSDGFYGAYWPCKTPSTCAMIAMIGDDPEDYLARSCVKWLHRFGVNVLTMSPAKKDYGHHNYPLERIETAIGWLKARDIRKIGIVGASTTGTLALTAASYFSDITLSSGLFVRFAFQSARKFPKECKAARIHIDRRLSAALDKWIHPMIEARFRSIKPTKEARA